MYELISLGVYLALLVVVFLFRRFLGSFWSSGIFFVGTMVWLAEGFNPGVPSSVMKLYGITLAAAVLLYVTSSDASRDGFWGPIRDLLVNPERRSLRLLVFLGISALMGWQTYATSLPSGDVPPLIRQVHPPPPNGIDVNPPGAKEPIHIDMTKGENPYLDLKKEDSEAYAERVAEGKAVYYQNCYYCHGDNLAADGHYATAMNPPPATFQSAGVIPMLQSTFLFWRVAKGGPGLPAGATPWDSAMPVWENFLSESEMWAVLLFLTDFTGYQPRVNEDLVEGGH